MPTKPQKYQCWSCVNKYLKIRQASKVDTNLKSQQRIYYSQFQITSKQWSVTVFTCYLNLTLE